MEFVNGFAATELAPGTQFGGYCIVQCLGQGATGAVYEVVKTSVGKRMALKVLHDALAVRGEALRRFEREARIGAAIEHPAVVQVFDVGEHDGRRFMAMELLEGESLQERLRRDKALSMRDIADIFVPLMSALGHVHDRGIVHRDLKPANIFLASRQGLVEPKLLDFGVLKDLSGVVGGEMTRTHAMLGSPSYMSPEQTREAKIIDVRSDQFAVGSILWECIVGRRLFVGDVLYQVLARVAEEPITRPSLLRPDLPRDVDALVMRALERDPDGRFASVRDIGVGLLPYCSDHVRTIWQEEFMRGSMDGGFASDDDEATALLSDGVVEHMTGPSSVASLPAFTDVGANRTATLPTPPFDVRGNFEPRAMGAETFEPSSRNVVPHRMNRSAFGFALGALSLSALMLTLALMMRFGGRHAPVDARPLATTTPSTLPPVNVPDAGGASASGVASPAVPVAENVPVSTAPEMAPRPDVPRRVRRPPVQRPPVRRSGRGLNI